MRNTDAGCEMRSRFFLGHVASRDPSVSFDAGKTDEIRTAMVTSELARRLHQHCTEEMSYLGELLPILYRQVTGDATF